MGVGVGVGVRVGGGEEGRGSSWCRGTVTVVIDVVLGKS